jgi:hypothetical protein
MQRSNASSVDKFGIGPLMFVELRPCYSMPCTLKRTGMVLHGVTYMETGNLGMLFTVELEIP